MGRRKGELSKSTAVADLTPEIAATFEVKKINLEALFDGANPFEEADGPGEVEKPTGPLRKPKILGGEEDETGRPLSSNIALRPTALEVMGERGSPSGRFFFGRGQ
jgi:hypothetical protein